MFVLSYLGNAPATMDGRSIVPLLVNASDTAVPTQTLAHIAKVVYDSYTDVCVECVCSFHWTGLQVTSILKRSLQQKSAFFCVHTYCALSLKLRAGQRHSLWGLCACVQVAPQGPAAYGRAWRDHVFIEYYFNDLNTKCADYPTEDIHNNFITIRHMAGSAFGDTSYSEYQSGTQSQAPGVNFDKVGGMCLSLVSNLEGRSACDCCWCRIWKVGVHAIVAGVEFGTVGVIVASGVGDPSPHRSWNDVDRTRIVSFTTSFSLRQRICVAPTSSNPS